MKLPKIDLPIFELELPSSGNKIRYRQFTVKEEKILLIAQESKDISQMILAIKQIVNNCLIDKDIEELATFDLEFILLTIRAKSVNNQVSFTIVDPDTFDKVTLELDLDKVKVSRNEAHTNIIPINSEYTLYMKYPTIDQFIDFSRMGEDPLINYKLMISCIDRLVSNETVYNFKDFSISEIEDFMESLNADTVVKIKDFFETLPKMRYEIPYKNSKGADKTFVIEGLQSFFL